MTTDGPFGHYACLSEQERPKADLTEYDKAMHDLHERDGSDEG